MSNAKKWLIAGGIVAVLCIAACGVTLLVVQQAGTQLGRTMKTDATGVAQVGAKIATYDLPAGYRQGLAMSIFMYDFVMYEPAGDQVGMSIMLMQFKTSSGYSTEQMQQALQEQSGQQGASMKVVKTYQATIRHQSSTVLIEEGTSSKATGITVRELITSFPGNNGTAMLMIVAPSEYWDQSLADEFIASIR